MLDPITKKMTDNSNEKQFSFSFHCDVCQHPWHSVPMGFSGEKQEVGEDTGKDLRRTPLWEKEHEAAYERANREAMLHFNRCPVCKRWVCDECFHMHEDGDACKECLDQTVKSLSERNR